MNGKPMSCELYDYIEIVCMKKYPINLSMKNGAVIECVAIDTATNEDRHECIKVRCGDDTLLVELSEIAKLSISVENPHFNSVSFC